MSRYRFAAAVAVAVAIAAGLPAGEASTPPEQPKPPTVDEPVRVDEPLDWWTLDKALVERLFTEDVDRLADSLASPRQQNDLHLQLRRLNLLVRAGRIREADAVIDRLAEGNFPQRYYYEAPTHGVVYGLRYILRDTVDFLTERAQWDLAQHLLEHFPRVEAQRAHWLIRHWFESGRDPEAIDQWLAARAEDNFAFWTTHRLRFRRTLRTEDELLKELAARVEKSPTDVACAIQHFHFIRNAGLPPERVKREAQWLAGVCRPRLAYECYQLGHEMVSPAPEAAIRLLVRSLNKKFTKKDQKRIDEFVKRNWAVFPLKDQNWKKLLRLWTKRDLADCYQKTGQSRKAQPLLEEVAAAEKDGLPAIGISRLAGSIQAGSGARVIEGRIKKAEQDNKDSPDYWLKRAEYYAGRNEGRQAIEAYEKALDLTALEGAATTATTPFERRQIRRGYVRFLSGTAGRPEAMQLLWRDFESAPLDTEYGRLLVWDILQFRHGGSRIPFNPTDERFWKYLAARGKWDHTENQLLWLMVEQTPESERDGIWNRAEKLARDADPSRTMTLAGLMARAHEPERAIGLVETVLRRHPDGDYKWTGIFDMYVDARRWKEAEAIWPKAMKKLTPREIPEWYGRLAIAAAKAGDNGAAMRLWRQRVNLDRTDHRSLDRLADLGLKPQLREFYGELSRKNPDGATVRDALATLR